MAVLGTQLAFNKDERVMSSDLECNDWERRTIE